MFHNFYKQCKQSVGRGKLYVPSTFFSPVLTFAMVESVDFNAWSGRWKSAEHVKSKKVSKLNMCVKRTSSFERLWLQFSDLCMYFLQLSSQTKVPFHSFSFLPLWGCLKQAFPSNTLSDLLPREAHSQRQGFIQEVTGVCRIFDDIQAFVCGWAASSLGRSSVEVAVTGKKAGTSDAC